MNCANHPDRERVAFCQHCGKPLCQECTRVVGSAVFCEPCLAARLAGTGTPPPASPGGSYTSTSDSVNYTVDGVIPPPQPGAPSPGLATLLGFIPGVGAMYNGQYAKGVVHLIVFAILVSLANENSIFGLFVAGWIVYQAIEANHTARARLAGTPLPNPFGLNDLGERLGFGKAWPSASTTNHTTGTPAYPTAPPNPPPAGYPPYTPPASQWGVPADSYAYRYAVPPVPPAPPVSPYGAPFVGTDPNASSARNRFPTGAIWLIGLGSIFLIGNIGIFHGFPMHRLIPFFLIGLGIWLFTRKMSDTGFGFVDDGTPMYRMRLLNALRGSMWVVLVGVLFLLDSFHILSWAHSWPLFIIVAGLMAILRSAAYSATVPPGYPYPQPPAEPPAQPTTTSIVPADQHDQEGS